MYIEYIYIIIFYISSMQNKTNQVLKLLLKIPKGKITPMVL